MEGSAGMPPFSARTAGRFSPLARISGCELAVCRAARLRRRGPRRRRMAAALGAGRSRCEAPARTGSAQGELPAPSAEDGERGVRGERRARPPLPAHHRRAREPLLNGRSSLLAGIVSVVVLFAASALGASGTFPGRNGGIAYNSLRKGNVDVYLRKANGKTVRLTRWKGSDLYPSFSADGKRIAFTRRRSGNDDIYVMSTSGKAIRRVTRSAQDDSDPTWSADGLHLAFTTFGKNDEIESVGVDGRGAVDLTNNPASDLDPAWSPDGTKIAFASARDDPKGDTYDIYVMNADGSNQVRLTQTPADDGEPTWSPDGTRIAFVTASGNRPDIAVMNADGSNPAPLTHTGQAFEPSWSPDGAKIAFTSLVKRRGEIYTINVDGTALLRLTRNGFDDGAPDWQSLR